MVELLVARGYAVLGLDLVPGPHTVACDLADEETIRAAVGYLPRVDLLVLCAFDDFRRAARRPKAIAVGAQFLILPATTFVLTLASGTSSRR